MIDGSIVRAHQHAAGALGGQDLQAMVEVEVVLALKYMQKWMLLDYL